MSFEFFGIVINIVLEGCKFSLKLQSSYPVRVSRVLHLKAPLNHATDPVISSKDTGPEKS
jgi:hypothetical protein